MDEPEGPPQSILVPVGDGPHNELAVAFVHEADVQDAAPGSIMEGEEVEGDEYIEKYAPATVEVGGAVAFVLDAKRVL